DGQFIAYSSLSTNLVSGQADANGGTDVFVFDRLAGTTRLVSGVPGSATTGNGASSSPAISGDGRFLAFHSVSTNLVSGQVDPNGASDVFLFDRLAGTTGLVSHRAGSTSTTGDFASTSPVISADGQFIAFLSGST